MNTLQTHLKIPPKDRQASDCVPLTLAVIHQKHTRLSSLHFSNMEIQAETDLRSALASEGKSAVSWMCFIGVQPLPELTSFSLPSAGVVN